MSAPGAVAPSRRKLFIGVALAIAFGYVALALFTDADRLTDALRRLGWAGCAWVLGLSAANYLLRFVRWKSFLAVLGHHVPTARHLLYYLGGFAFTVSPAKAGEAFRSLYLRAHGVGYADSIAALFVERVLDLFAMVLLASLIALDRPAYRPLIFAGFGVVALLIAAVSRESLPGRIERAGAALRPKLRALAGMFGNLLRSSRTLLRPGRIVSGTGLGLIAWGAEAAGFGIICRNLHLSGSFAAFCGIYAVAVLAGSAAIFLPAGIGGTELVMTTLLVERGAELRVAILATLMCRLATLWFAVLLGIGAALSVEVSAHRGRAAVLP